MKKFQKLLGSAKHIEPMVTEPLPTHSVDFRRLKLSFPCHHGRTIERNKLWNFSNVFKHKGMILNFPPISLQSFVIEKLV